MPMIGLAVRQFLVCVYFLSIYHLLINMNNWPTEWMTEWINVMNKWINEWTNEWMNKWLKWTNEWRLTFSTPSRISVGSSPIENMLLTIAARTNVSTVESRGKVTAAARETNIVTHTIPDTRPSSSVKQTDTRKPKLPYYILNWIRLYSSVYTEYGLMSCSTHYRSLQTSEIIFPANHLTGAKNRVFSTNYLAGTSKVKCKVPLQRLWWRHLNLDICSSTPCPQKN